MSTLTPQTCVLLEHLLASYRRAELAFGRIAIEIQPDRLQGLLRNYAQMRSQLAAELEGALHHFRSAYHPHSVPSANDFVPGRGAGDSDVGSVLAECGWYDEQTLKLYPSILRRELPQPLRKIVSRQHSAVQADYQRLCELIRSLATAAMTQASG